MDGVVCMVNSQLLPEMLGFSSSQTQLLHSLCYLEKGLTIYINGLLSPHFYLHFHI